MRPLLLAVLLVPHLSAAWERLVTTDKGALVDTAGRHPLSYFTKEATRGTKLSLGRVGSMAGYLIYDLYLYNRYQNEYQPGQKSILVKLPSGEYREINHCEPVGVDGACQPSRIIKLGVDEFLEARYDTHKYSVYEYFWFDASGPTLVDFRPLLFAARALVPKGNIGEIDEDLPGAHSFWTSGEPLVSRFAVWSEAENRYVGAVEVEFRFDHGRVVATKSSHDPNAK